MFTLQKEPLETSKLRATLSDNPHAGAWVVFEGRVRKMHHGKDVRGLEYEAYDPLVMEEAKKIFVEAKQKFEILEYKGAHRLGYLGVGELALWLAVASPHRRQGFAAIQYIIDEIKKRFPVWKKEFFLDGSSSWVACKECCHSKPDPKEEEKFYNRQIRLPRLGKEGQKKLKKSRVLVVGAGGLGCPVLSYLAAAGIGHIGVCDSDRVDVTNLHRQVLYSYRDIGKSKAETAKKILSGSNPFIELRPYDQLVDVNNASELIPGHDVVLDCTDHLQTKFLLHDVCRKMAIPLIQAAIYRFEGHLQVFRHQEDIGCLRCLWPKVPQNVESCNEGGILGVTTGFLGTLQAMEAIKVLLDWPEVVDKHMLLVDMQACSISKIRRSKSADCPLCATGTDDKVKQDGLLDDLLSEEWEIELSPQKRSLLDDFELLDIRNDEERDSNNPWEEILRKIPIREFDRPETFREDQKYLLICQKGRRSKILADKLRAEGYGQFYSLKGGIAYLNKSWIK